LSAATPALYGVLWMRRLRLFADEEEEERVEAEPAEDVPAGRGWRTAIWLTGIALVALAPRLFTLYWLTDPENAGDGWLGDVYHHWQIAYLTREIGLSAPGGPRLWDLKGLEYFWGVLHPILMVGLFTVTGSVDIVLARLLSLGFGVLVVLMIFLLCRRYWGTGVALGACAFAALAPTSVFDDTSGMLEPIGVGLCLLAIWLWPKRGLWAGVALALAAMARAEAWMFSAGLLLATFLKREAIQQRLAMVCAWGALMLLYMKVLLDRTGNPIYPVWWNYLANAVGVWEYRPQLTAAEQAVRPILVALMAAGVAGLGVTLWRRPRSYLFFTFGFGYLAFTGGVLGASAYLKSWESWFWMTRFFVFPYQFAAALVAIALLAWVPSRLGRPTVIVGWAVVLAGLLAVQAEWTPILSRYQPTRPIWANAVAAGEDLGAMYDRPQYRDGALNMPSGNPDVVYTLVRYGHVQGRHIVGQLYDPFYYLPPGYSYQDHRQDGGMLLRCWLTQTGTRVWAIAPTSGTYLDFVRDHPTWFHPLGTVRSEAWTVEEVRVPKPSSTECSLAARRARS
jgi:hypothetical protein